MSRQNTVPSSNNPSETVSALIPLWDMFNHRSGSVRYYNLLIYETINGYCDFKLLNSKQCIFNHSF